MPKRWQPTRARVLRSSTTASATRSRLTRWSGLRFKGTLSIATMARACVRSVLLLPYLSGLACAQTSPQPGTDGIGSNFHSERITIGNKDLGYFDTSSRWPSLDNGNTVVFVCWENDVITSSVAASWVRLAVTKSWQNHSKLEFRGWQTCTRRSSGIRIRVIDDSPTNGPHTAGLGRALAGRPSGMVLNFTFKNWGRNCASSNAEIKSCVESIAVHEFGHAIGFAHEQNRADVPGECRKLAQGPDGTVLLTPYDSKSVMNYCNSLYNNLGNLSDLDIVSVQQIYGRP